MIKLRHLSKMILISVSAILLMTGCKVDKDYDVSKITGGDIVIGSRFELTIVNPYAMKLGSIIDISGVLELTGLDEVDINTVVAILGTDFYESEPYGMNLNMDDDLIKTLTEDEDLNLRISVKSTIPVAVNVHLEFIQPSGEPVVLEPGMELSSYEGQEISADFDYLMSSELLYNVTNANAMQATISLVPDEFGNYSSAMFDNDDFIEFSMHLIKEGGIRL